MKICIYGAGAIGGLLGARLARAGAEVTLIARGPHLEALRTNGLRLLSDGEDFTVRPKATDRPAEVGQQDAVIVALKAQSVPGVVEHMQPLLGPKTGVVMAVNGLPWWYFYRLEVPGATGAWTASIPRAGSGRESGRSAPSAASSMPRRK